MRRISPLSIATSSTHTLEHSASGTAGHICCLGRPTRRAASFGSEGTPPRRSVRHSRYRAELLCRAAALPPASLPPVVDERHVDGVVHLAVHERLERLRGGHLW